MWSEFISDVGDYGTMIEEDIRHASKDVNTDGEGVNVVHAEVVWCQLSEDEAAEEQRDHSDANTRAGCEDPDEKDECCET